MTIPAPNARLSALGAVAFALGEEMARLRADLLGPVGSALDAAVAGVAEADELTPEVWKLLAESGWRLLDPRAANGISLDLARLTVATEALATRRQTFVMPLLLSALASMPLVLDGTPEQQKRLESIGAGRTRAAFALSEPGAGSDISATASSARRVGDHYVLNGTKTWISVPGEVDWLVMFTRAPDAKRATELSCYLVEAAAPGVTITRRPAGLGMLAVPLCDVVLAEVSVPGDSLIGEEGKGFGIAMRALNAVRPIVAARGLGLVAGVIMAAQRYVEERSAFGETLVDLQLVRTKLADLAARLEASRLLTYHAAALVDRLGVGKKQAPILSAAKLVATELAVEAAGTCMHLAGAAGYTDALPFARALRDAQQLTIVEGVSEVQLELVARGLAERTLWWDRA